MFLDAATERRPVIMNSLATMIATIQAGIRPLPTKAIKAEQTRILSANGSTSFPKLVICPLFLAICPSRRSVMLAKMKRTIPTEFLNSILPRITSINKIVRKILDSVILFGVFMLLLQ